MQNQTASTANLVSSSLMGLFFIVGVPGNIAVIVLIVRHFKKDNFTVHLMLNLAVADILCLITLPGWIYSELNSIGQETCMFFTSLVYCSMYSSVITVSALSMYRCLRIRHPQMWSRMDRRKERTLLFTNWVLALVFSFPGVFTQDSIEGECERNLNSHGRLIVAALESLLGFVLPLIIILTSYYYLHKMMTQRLKKHRQRLTQLVTRIIIMFLICWAPHHIIKLTDIFVTFFNLESPLPNISDIVGCLTFLNSCVNPFLYAFSSKNLRQQNQPGRNLPMSCT
ncbi:putative leukotriene B4 receptor 1-like [Triplophysa rosa]|uniref:Leukotriene B4 receptor 1-like n=1 Tax=Triplophysa rosa TaxID=992332 RepID=A0A9W7X581_TRIRA|nr:putative leukotriene B4 receptor 1-like [Triplophysa rosa]